MKKTIILSLQGLSEIIIMFTYPFMGIAKLFVRTGTVNHHNTKKYPIVIFEQWFFKNILHVFLKRSLEQKGYRVYWTSYSIFQGGVEEGSKYLKKYMDQNCLHDVILVGISMGAVSSFDYLQKRNGWKKVRKFISVGAPFKGSPCAYFLFFLKAGRQLFPDSSFSADLLKQSILHPEKILCISAQFDQLVPFQSSRLSGAKNITIDTAGHNNLQVITPSLLNVITQQAGS